MTIHGEKAVCSSCGTPIEYNGTRGYWDHTETRPKHPAVPGTVKKFATAEEFIPWYVSNYSSKLDATELFKLGYRAVGCTCKFHGCRGWRMVHTMDIHEDYLKKWGLEADNAVE